MAGLADGVAVEITGRAVQGAGSALIAPAALTLLFMTFGANPKELPKALALYGAAAPAGGTAGVFLGGVLTEYASWPWVFFINLPIAAVVLALTPSVMPAGAAQRGRVDVLGALTVTLGLAAVVFAVVRAPEMGWGSAGTVVTGLVGIALLVLFVVLQARSQAPLMRLGILRAPNLAAANIAQLLLGAAWIPMFFFINLYLQQVLGLGAFESGAALLPLTVTIMLGMIAFAPRLTEAYGPKAMTVGGLFVLAVGLVWLSFVDADGSYVVDVLPATLVTAAGMAMAFIPSLGTALSAAAPEEGGLALGPGQHQLPGGLGPGPGRDDRRGRRLRRRPGGRRGRPHRRLLGRLRRCRRHRARRCGGRRPHAADLAAAHRRLGSLRVRPRRPVGRHAAAPGRPLVPGPRLPLPEDPMRTIHLDVGGMRCRRCVRRATALLRDVPGIATLVADPRTSRITITGDVTERAVLQALASTSFTVRVTAASAHPDPQPSAD